MTVWRLFFSSRRRHTRCGRDWSSDVCSSDLGERIRGRVEIKLAECQGNNAHRRPRRDCAFNVASGQDARIHLEQQEIGRASCRERGKISVVAVSLKKKKKSKRHTSGTA